jgi:hypothetical protein
MSAVCAPVVPVTIFLKQALTDVEGTPLPP